MASFSECDEWAEPVHQKRTGVFGYTVARGAVLGKERGSASLGPDRAPASCKQHRWLCWLAHLSPGGKAFACFPSLTGASVVWLCGRTWTLSSQLDTQQGDLGGGPCVSLLEATFYIFSLTGANKSPPAASAGTATGLTARHVGLGRAAGPRCSPFPCQVRHRCQTTVCSADTRGGRGPRACCGRGPTRNFSFDPPPEAGVSLSLDSWWT